jgi:RNA polymerase sigma factor (TIGR02999 family)
MAETHSITRMLNEWGDGDEQALEALIPLVYDELRRQATNYLRYEKSGHTLQPTALINEVFLKLIDNQKIQFNDRSHFFAIMANMMRRFLVDHARGKNRNKRGGSAETLPLEKAAEAFQPSNNIDLIALDEALTKLEKFDERLARVVELHYFSGLSLPEVADVMNFAVSTVKSDWAIAKAWLRRELSK